jgi:guanylate kinase
MSSRGRVFIVSAPSGSGKSTLLAKLLAETPDLVFSISFTTRKPRGGEQNGVEYFFVTESVFEKMIGEGRFVEHARVFDHYYGTAIHTLEEVLMQGKDMLLDIDTEGASQVKMKIPDAVSIFIMPPSFDALHERLKRRQLDNDETIQKRLRWASQVEVYRFKNYDYVVINDDIRLSLHLMQSIVAAERCRRERMAERVENIIQTFGGV